MRTFSAITAVVTAAVLSIALGLGPLQSINAAASPARHVAVTEARSAVGQGQGYAVWICQWMPYLSPLCR